MAAAAFAGSVDRAALAGSSDSAPAGRSDYCMEYGHSVVEEVDHHSVVEVGHYPVVSRHYDNWIRPRLLPHCGQFELVLFFFKK